MVAYIRSDLDFILAQIKIAEAHTAGQPLYGPAAGADGIIADDPATTDVDESADNGLIPTYNLAWGLRTVDGSYNHLLPGQEQWGAADQEFLEHLNPQYRTVMVDPDGAGPSPAIPITYTPGNDVDGPGTRAGPGDVIDPQVRTISNLIVDQTLGNPAAILTALQRAGIDDPGMLITAQISALYAPLKDAFRAVADAQRVEAAAAAAAAANPANGALQTAAANAAIALTASQNALDALAGVPGGLYEKLTANGIELDGANVHLPNIAPDEGLSAPFNSWFTLFGQFFDHGLDLVGKGGSGTVMIPLQPDDPLYSTAPGALNFMVLTRATTAGPDGIQVDNPLTIGIDESADNTRPINTTTAYVDQNQTYTSHASHQVFVREYALGTDGRPHATGNLIEGANGGMATWGEVKAQALMLGIELTDLDVGNIPLLRTDAYGNFIPNAAGYAQVITGIGTDGVPNTADDIVVSGTPDAPVNPTLAGAIRIGHAFLADIAHGAAPDGLADGDTEIGGNIPVDGVYDNELLDAHFIAGDGRVNENIGLTAVHHVFHAEHNRLVEHTKEVALASGDLAFLNEWLSVDVAALPTTPEEIAALVWDGGRIFQAAKFGTEMQYQHLVFEEFARKIQPNINVFLVPDGFDTTLNPSIVAEFAHVVYRFGHSMLTESIDSFDPTFTADHISLIQGFLNPTAFDGVNHAITDDVAAGAIIRGMTRQGGNEIDEFVTSALRNNLLGLPLDLATINLARGRDTGVPSLNEARAEFFAASNQDVILKPYESWTDFAGHLKHEASIINFIAAYGTHPLIEAESTIEGKRAAAFAIVFDTPQIVSGPETTGVAWNGPEGVAWIGLATPASSIDENILVDDAYYNSHNPDVLAAGIDPDLHFALFGAAEGRRPNQFSNFDGARYLAENPDVAAAGMDPLIHFLAFGRFEGRLFYSVAIDENILVDDAYYNFNNPDVLAAGIDPDLHFALFGAAEGRSANQFFDAAYYLANNPGVTGNLLEHFLTTGWVSGRNPSANFDGARYLAENPDVAAAGMNPLLHFLAFGRFEGRLSYPVPVELINPPADRLDFLNATGAYAATVLGSTLGGLNNVDLWIGGLAEEIMPFGGMLGSTFNFVFETQMENLQSGDRFYYLQRLDGLHLFGEMENNSFASMIMRNTNATHLPSDVFSTPGLILEVDRTKQYNPGLGEDAGLDGIMDDNPGTAVNEAADNRGNDPTGGSILTPLVVRDNPSTVGPDGNYLLYTGDEHVLLGGTQQADTLIASIGDDTLFGDGGNDRLEGGFGNDIINGGEGDDIIKDLGGDDNIKAEGGNDVVHAGPGLDLVMGGRGQDFIFLGTDAGSEVFAGEGNDFIFGNKNAERILGNEGNDWIETGTFDGAPGDNFDEIFAHDGIAGHDVFLGDGGFDEFIGEGGDDIMVGSPGRGKMVGMSGFDWATYKDLLTGVNADLSIPIIFDEAPTLPQNAALDEYESMEGLSGTRFNDVLKGTQDVAADRAPLSDGGTTGYLGSELNAEGIALIAGLQEVLGAGVTSFDGGDIILGGDGSDTITGNAGDDIIDGDKWLDVQIGVFAAADVNHTGTPIAVHNSMTSLATAMFDGTINPGQLSIVRTIRTDTTAGDIDTAVYQGNFDEYTLGFNDDGTFTVDDLGGNALDGRDTLRNIERLDFLDQDVNVVVGTAAADTLIGTAGIDLIQGLGGVDTLDMSTVIADATVDLRSSPLSAGTASSTETGNDMIWGIENVNTGSGDDIITASDAVNVMNGGTGNDTYVFTSAAAANGDSILTFEAGDRVDLTAIDAISGGGNQSFTLFNGQLNGVAGQLAFEFDLDANVTVVQGDIDGNSVADFTFEIAGNQTLTAGNTGL